MANRHYWVGIDEAGYGPNLGPLVVTAIVARGGSNRPPDVWNDLPGVCRAQGGHLTGLCVDDSKRVLHRRDGLALMEQAFFATLDTICPPRRKSLDTKIHHNHLIQAFGPDIFGGNEIHRWTDDAAGGLVWNRPGSDDATLQRLACRRWRVTAARVAVVGPERFNRLLDRTNNKSEVNGLTFLSLIDWLKNSVPEGSIVHVTTDRHGGRHFYGPLLSDAFPGIWITKCEETAATSRYRIETERNTFEIDFVVRADAANGLVALASMISKLVRERWMERFNAWFARRVPELKPTAGYPVDAKRFLGEIEGYCRSDSLSMDRIWRRK